MSPKETQELIFDLRLFGCSVKQIAAYIRRSVNVVQGKLEAQVFKVKMASTGRHADTYKPFRWPRSKDNDTSKS